MTMLGALSYMTLFVICLLKCLYFFGSVVFCSTCCISDQLVSFSKCANSPDANSKSDQRDQVSIKCPYELKSGVQELFSSSHGF